MTHRSTFFHTNRQLDVAISLCLLLPVLPSVLACRVPQEDRPERRLRTPVRVRSSLVSRVLVLTRLENRAGGSPSFASIPRASSMSLGRLLEPCKRCWDASWAATTQRGPSSVSQNTLQRTRLTALWSPGRIVIHEEVLQRNMDRHKAAYAAHKTQTADEIAAAPITVGATQVGSAPHPSVLAQFAPSSEAGAAAASSSSSSAASSDRARKRSRSPES